MNAEMGLSDRARLSDSKRALLVSLLGGHKPAPLIRRDDRRQEGPLSFAQQRLWFLEQLNPGRQDYNIAGAVRLEGDLDLAALRRSFDAILARHESLRTRFILREESPVQVIMADWRLEMQVADASEVKPEDRVEWVREAARREAKRGFDLERGPLMRACLLRLGAEEHVLVLTMHHIVFDGWSMGVLVRELIAIYEAQRRGQEWRGPELPVKYLDYAVWQREWMQEERQREQIEYWKKQLKRPLAMTVLEPDHPWPAMLNGEGARRSRVLPVGLQEKLKRLAREEEVTLFMLLLAGFQILLQRRTGQKEIVVGSPIANRSRAELEGLIGFFVNTLVLRGDLSGRPTVREVVGRLREMVSSAYAHQDLPFERLVDELQPVRDLGRQPLFQILFTFQNIPRPKIESAKIAMTIVGPDYTPAIFPLQVDVVEREEGMTIAATYSAELYRGETIKGLLEHFEQVLDEMVAEPNAQISALGLMKEAEQRQLAIWNRTELDYEQSRSINESIEDLVAARPDSTALVDEHGQLSYGELNRRANQLAHYLRQQGVGPEVFVALLMERGLEMVIGILGVLKSGGAYVPLDPNYPAERLAYMLEDARAPVLLTQRAFVSKLPVRVATIICLDSDWQRIEQESELNPAPLIRSENPAYVIYTSGSTGRPKGVVISHRNVARLFSATKHWFHFGQDDVWTHFHSYAFDFSVWELLGALLHGGRLVVVPYLTSRSPGEFLDLLVQEGVTVVNQTPSAFYQLMQADSEDSDSGRKLALRYVIFGGEALEIRRLADWSSRHPNTPALINMYGITETTIHVTYAALLQEKIEAESLRLNSTIGHGIPDLQVYVLDEDFQPVQVGVRGELYIAGAGLARGYLNRPELTSERFVANPYGTPGTRMYRTGDLARWRTEGGLEYLGRTDQQVKIRGFRIELGEIEALLSEQAGVRQAVVMVREEQLVAYVVGEADPKQLQASLQSKLPSYMVPSKCIPLERFFLTPNGKVDRKALPAPELDKVEEGSGYVEPRTPTEKLLADIWATVLGFERVGVEDNFFKLGGDSILSIQVIAKARQSGLQLTTRHLFEQQTIAGLAAAAGNISISPAEEGMVTGEFALTPIQCALFERRLNHPHHYNQSVLLELPGGIESGLLEQVIRFWLERHDALRLRFEHSEGQWRQWCTGTDGAAPFERRDWADIPPIEHRARLDRDVVEVQASLDLSRGPLLRVVHYDLGAERPGRLLVVIHHLAVDGVSWRILLEELQQGYKTLSQNHGPSWPAKTSSYKRWSEALRQYARSEEVKAELPYWIEQSRKEAGRLPINNLHGENRVGSVNSVTVWLTHEETRKLLQEVPGVYRTQINDVLLTALADALSEWSGRRRVRIDLEGHGRDEEVGGVDLSRTVGWFTTIYPVVLEVEPEKGPGDRLKAVKEQLRGIPRRGLCYGLLRYVNREEQLRDALPSELCFNYLGQFNGVFGDAEFLRPTEESSGPTQDASEQRQYLIEINGLVAQGRLKLNWEYSEEVHTRETIEKVSGRFLEQLKELIAHCQSEGVGGYTPSDFPLANVGQQELDRLIGAEREIEDLYPLSPMQQGLLFHSLYTPDSGVYVEQFSCLIKGSIDLEAFKRAWETVLARHPILRTYFLWEGLAEPLQAVKRRVARPWQQEYWRGMSGERQEHLLNEFLAADRKRGFELSRAPLLRLALIQMETDCYQFIWSHHHLLLDGWCRSLLVKEVYELYEAECRDERVQMTRPRPYRDYISWLQQQDLSRAEAYWRKTLRGFSAPTPLGIEKEPIDRRNPVQEHIERSLRLSVKTTAELEAMARQSQVTLNTVLQGAWGVLLSRYSRESDVVFGATVAGRPAELPGSESMMGLFINTLPVRVQAQGAQPAGEYFRQLQAEQVEARQYDYSPLTLVQSWSEVKRGVSLFESLLAFENYPVDRVVRERASAALGITEVRSFEQTNYALTLIVVPGQEISLNLGYGCEGFEADAIERMLGHLESVLTAIIARPDARLWDLPMLKEIERQQIIVEWNDTRRDFLPFQPLHRLVEAQVRCTPEAVAVAYEGQHLSYGELDRRANRLAHHLQGLGVRPETRVGLCLERSLELMIALLGTIKAGGAYVPLDSSYPADRLAFMVKDAQAHLLITQHHLLTMIPQPSTRLLCLDREWPAIARQSDLPPVVSVEGGNLAYLIYTSGSTGRPKGVMIPHAGITNRLQWMQQAYTLRPADRVLQKTPFSFDVSVWEFFWPLMIGATLVMARPGGHRDVDYLVRTILEQQVTTLHFVPSMLQVFLEAEKVESCVTLSLVICSGEALLPTHQERFYQRLEAALHNLYGPTEASVDVTSWACRNEIGPSNIPIGRPIANTQIYTLDTDGQPVAIGVAGELYIGGIGLGRGYLNLPELTAEKFVPDQYSILPGQRLYRSGDLARYESGGSLEYLGRIDGQVKLRGFRIELGEIEALLNRHPKVSQSVAVVRERESGDKQLMAYVVAKNPEDAPSPSSLRQYLSDWLPEYMTPSAYVRLEELPLTPSGKVNRQALPAEPPRASSEPGDLAPRTPIEELLAEIWARVLHRERVGIRDNIYELGAHSLLAVRLVSWVRRTFRIELPLRSLFEHPTIAELARVVEAGVGNGLSPAQPPLRKRERSRESDEELALSFAQQRLWFLDQLTPGRSTYNIPIALRMIGRLEVGALERALSEVVRRHESLRTTFRMASDEPSQVIGEAEAVRLKVEDLSRIEEREREAEAKRLTAEEASSPFNLAVGPLIRVRLLRLCAEDHVLLCTMHHIVSDGWSIGVLMREVGLLYEAYGRGVESPLEELEVQYADYAIWQREWLQGEVLEREVNYWKKQLSGAPPIMELPTDRPRPAAGYGREASRRLMVSADIVRELRRLSRAEEVTLFMTLLAAWQVLLSRYSGQDDIVIGTPTAGRLRAETEGLIGFFVNTLALRTDLSGHPTFQELLRRVREVTFEAYAHQELPFEKLVEELQPERDLKRTPLFQVMIALQNTPEIAAGMKLSGLELKSAGGEVERTAKFDLTLELNESGEELRGVISYNTDLFEAKTIERMVGHFRMLLAGAIDNLQQRITELPLLDEAERRQLLEWNRTERDYPREKCLHQLFEAQVEKAPEAIAVIYGEEEVTYQKLNERANRLAHYLERLGVRPEVRVGICLERSVEMIIGLLGILKAGGTYLPLDLSYPVERLEFMVRDGSVRVVLSKRGLTGKLMGGETVRLVDLDEGRAAIERESGANPNGRAFAENLAYIIYTSGSTGHPKGIGVTHRAVNRLVNNTNYIEFVTGDRVAQASNTSFDAMTFEVWGGLLNSAALVLVEPDVMLSPRELGRFLKEQEASVLFLTTALFNQVAREIPGAFGRVRQLMFGGEAVSIRWVREVQRAGGPRRFLHVYGPTESTTFATWHEIGEVEDEADTIPIGGPLTNTRIYVLDREMQLVHVGMSGELYIGGDGLARGYLERADLTAEKFLPNPFNDGVGERLYRSGDLVKYGHDGELEFLARIDEQVKLRGYRIELGEIEAALKRHRQVKQCVVMVREEEPGDKRLVAYVVGAEKGAAPGVSELQEHLSEWLPDYMAPAAYVMLGELPLTPNGKIDRKALPAPDRGRPELDREFVAPRTPIEQTLAEIWTGMLRIERIGIYDNFFELGGHSLLATQIISRLRTVFQVEIPLRPMFESPMIAALAEMIAQSQEDQKNRSTDKIKRADPPAEDYLLKNLDRLSDEDVNLLLNQLCDDD